MCSLQAAGGQGFGAANLQLCPLQGAAGPAVPAPAGGWHQRRSAEPQELREPLLAPPGLQPRTYPAWQPARPWPAHRAPRPGGSTSSPPRPAGTAGPRGAGSGTRRSPLGHCQPRSLQGTGTVTPHSRCTHPLSVPAASRGCHHEQETQLLPRHTVPCCMFQAAVPFCTFRRCCSRTGTVSLTMLVCVDTAARACRQRCRRERRSRDLSSSRSEGKTHPRGVLGWHPGHLGPSLYQGRWGAEAQDYPKPSQRLPAIAGQLLEGSPSCSP